MNREYVRNPKSPVLGISTGFNIGKIDLRALENLSMKTEEKVRFF
jgi:hypothetical protein